MGNSKTSLRGFGIQSNIGDGYYRVKLGGRTIVEFREKRTYLDEKGRCNEAWYVLYDINGSKCVVHLIAGQDGGLCIGFGDVSPFLERWNLVFDIVINDKEDNQQLDNDGNVITYVPHSFWSCERRVSENIADSSSSDLVTDHTVALYSREDLIRKHKKTYLFVVDMKRRRECIKPYAVTLVHYYAVRKLGMGNNLFRYQDENNNWNDIIGLSMVVRIGINPNNRKLEYKVEGPTQHPSYAIFYMIDQVMTTGIWKPSSCPHCVTNTTTTTNFDRLSQHSDSASSSESDDEDDQDNGNDLPRRLANRNGATPAAAAALNSRAIVANHGVTRGDFNGNVLIKKFILDFKKSLSM